MYCMFALTAMVYATAASYSEKIENYAMDFEKTVAPMHLSPAPKPQPLTEQFTLVRPLI